MKSTTVVIALLLIAIAVLSWLLIAKQAEAPSVQNPATTTTTTTAATNSGNTGSAEITPAPKPLHTKIAVTFPKSGASVPHAFTVTGKAPGNWFSEAQAPIMVQAEDGSKIAQGQMRATGDWMTTNLVDFTAAIEINQAYSGPATLVLLKDNPSGLPQNDDSLEIPIVVK